MTRPEAVKERMSPAAEHNQVTVAEVKTITDRAVYEAMFP
jgi:hypothetical protein